MKFDVDIKKYVACGLATLYLAFSYPANANEIVRPTRMADLTAFYQEEFYAKDTLVFIKNTKLAYINLPALRRDFPQLRPLSDDQIKALILEEFSYISIGQLKLQGLRFEGIEVDMKKTKETLRTKSAQRTAHVSFSKFEGLIDLKGIGVSPFSMDSVHRQLKKAKELTKAGKSLEPIYNDSYTDFISSLTEIIADLTRQSAIQAIYNQGPKEGEYKETVESYFSIDTGGSLIKAEGARIPMGIDGRQTAYGRVYQYGVDHDIYRDFKGFEQQTIYSAAIDFGAVLITHPKLEHVFTFNHQISKAISHEDGLKLNPQSTKCWRYAYDTAIAFRQGKDYVVYNHLKEMLAPLGDYNVSVSNLHPLAEQLHKLAKRVKTLSPTQVGALISTKEMIKEVLIKLQNARHKGETESKFMVPREDYLEFLPLTYFNNEQLTHMIGAQHPAEAKRIEELLERRDYYDEGGPQTSNEKTCSDVFR